MSTGPMPATLAIWNETSSPKIPTILRERSPWADIPKHRITDSLIYDLPFGKGRHFMSHSNGWIDAAIGGWQFTQSLTWSTGFFLNPLWTGPDPTGTANTTSATAPTV